METAHTLAEAHRVARESREKEKLAKQQRLEWAHETHDKRTAKLAEQLSDPNLFLLALRYYCQLPPGETVSRPSLPAKLSRKVRAHLQAARRILLVQWRPDSLRLPRTWLDRLANVGIKLEQAEDLSRFMSLPADLMSNDATVAFAASHPELLERTQRFLCGERPRPAQQESARKDKRTGGKPLHAALVEPEPTDEDTDDDEPAEEERAFNRAAWLQARINAFLGSKG